MRRIRRKKEGKREGVVAEGKEERRRTEVLSTGDE